MYVDSKNKGKLNYFVCDFIQDKYGRFNFSKISEFDTDGNPVNQDDW